MLKYLHYEVTFSTPHKTIKGDVDFEAGLTAITGPNESGKTMVLELIRFALFGTAALRAKLSRYESVLAELKWESNGAEWWVGRMLTRVELRRNKKVVATGATAVNAHIEREAFGYGLGVFDIANHCMQGKVEKLTDMGGTERRQMIGKVIGFEQIDSGAAWATQEASAARGAVTALERARGPAPVPPAAPAGYLPVSELDSALAEIEPAVKEEEQIKNWLLLVGPTLRAPREPVAPTVPEGYQRSEKLAEAVAQAGSLAAEVSELTSWLRLVGSQLSPPMAPVEPPPLDVDGSAQLRAGIDELKPMAVCRDQLYGRISAMAGSAPAPKAPEPCPVTETLPELRQYQETRQAAIARSAVADAKCPKCGAQVFSESEVHVPIDRSSDITTRANWERDNATYQLRLSTWKESREKIEQLKVELAELESLLKILPQLEEDYENAKLLEQTWREYKDIKASYETQHSEYVTLMGQKAIKEQRLAQLGDVADELKRLQALSAASIRYETELYYFHTTKAAYDSDVAVYNGNVATKAKHEKRLKKLDDAAGSKQVLQGLREIAMQHETNLRSHAEAEQRYIKACTDIANAKGELDQYEAVQKAIKLLRLKIKAHLVPSLNTAASVLLAKMTNGQRNRVEIDDELEEILVDGQPIETLSGSAKAVVNLAIRVGLGQILTNKVFSVFMGDEIDAAMDAGRAAATAECFAGLAKVIKQVIIVSHKALEADHHIELERAA